MFLKKKPADLLISLLDEDLYLSQLAKKADSTYVYVTKMATLFKAKGYVEIVPKGKFRVLRLTPKGREMAILLKQVKEKESS